MRSMLTGVGFSSAAASCPSAEANTQGKRQHQGCRHHRKSSAILWSIYHRYAILDIRAMTSASFSKVVHGM